MLNIDAVIAARKTSLKEAIPSDAVNAVSVFFTKHEQRDVSALLSIWIGRNASGISVSGYQDFETIALPRSKFLYSTCVFLSIHIIKYMAVIQFEAR